MRKSVFALLLLLCSPVASLAQPDLSPLQRPSRPMREAAQAHYQSGTRFFDAGSYDAALVEFEAAYRLSAEPDLLHNLSWTHEKAGHIKDALDYALRYQAAVQTDDERERARKRVEFLKQRYSSAPAPSEPAAASSTPVVSPAAVPAPASVRASAPGPAPAPTKTEARTKTPPLALGLVAGGSALASSRNRLSGGRVGDGAAAR